MFVYIFPNGVLFDFAPPHCFTDDIILNLEENVCFITTWALFSYFCLCLCQHDYTKSTELTCTKLDGGMWYESGKNPLKFGRDAIKGADKLPFIFIL